MAVVGKGFAMLQSGNVHISGSGRGLLGQPCISNSWRRRVSVPRLPPRVGLDLNVIGKLRFPAYLSPTTDQGPGKW